MSLSCRLAVFEQRFRGVSNPISYGNNPQDTIITMFPLVARIEPLAAKMKRVCSFRKSCTHSRYSLSKSTRLASNVKYDYAVLTYLTQPQRQEAAPVVVVRDTLGPSADITTSGS